MLLYYAGKNTIASSLFPVSIEWNHKKASNFHFRIVQSSETIIREKLFRRHAKKWFPRQFNENRIINYCVIIYLRKVRRLSLIDCFHGQQIEERRNKTRFTQNQSIAEIKKQKCLVIDSAINDCLFDSVFDPFEKYHILFTFQQVYERDRSKQ